MHEELAAALGAIMGVVNMAFFSLAGASLVLVRACPASLGMMIDYMHTLVLLLCEEWNRAQPPQPVLPGLSTPSSLAAALSAMLSVVQVVHWAEVSVQGEGNFVRRDRWRARWARRR